MSGAPAWLKTTVGALSRLAPRPVAWLALRLYRRPAIARRFDGGDREMLTIAEGLLRQGEAHGTKTPGGPLRWWRFGDPHEQPAVLLLHGWTADARAMAGFIKPLTERGFAAIIPDLPAHGDSFGVETDALASARAVAAMLRAEGLAPRQIIGHSFGGGVAGMLAQEGFAPERMVAIASPSRLLPITSDFCDAFGLAPAARRRLFTLAEQAAGITHDELDALRVWPPHETEILILHAPDDEEIDFAEAERGATLPKARLSPMPGLGHRRIVYDERSVSAAVAFLAGAT